MPNSNASQPKPTYTPEQSAAIAASEFSVALSAGAGCGKTFVLTERFLAHLEPATNPRERTRLGQLVAITFTERAAREMRDRIRKACHERLLGCPEEQVEHWRELLRELDSARISTIHSFCGSLLRSHAVEAGLDPRFRVLDQAQSDTLAFELIDRELRRWLADRDEAVIELVVKYGLNRVREMVGLLLEQRQDIDFPAWRGKTPEDLTGLWEKFFNESVFPVLLREIADSPDARTVLEFARQKPCPCDHAAMRARLAIIEETLPLVAKETNPASALARLKILHENARVQGGGTKKNWPSEELFNEFKEAAAALRKQIENFQKRAAFDADASLPVAEMAMRLFRLTEEVVSQYEREKQTLGVLDFNDLLIHAKRLLVGDGREAIRRRWAEHLRLLMVDEFQDTDPLQVELVKALCDHEVAGGKLFFVGDFKQSIYRFRGADPHVFRLLREEIPERGRLPLSENFRSQPGIIDFVNALFDEEFGENYESLRSRRPQTAPRPSVEFLWAEEESTSNLPSPIGGHHEVVGAGGEGLPASIGEILNNNIQPSDPDYTPAERRRRVEADWIARRIRAMLDGGEKLVGDKEAEKAGNPAARAVRPGDIALLFRALTDVAYYEEALRRYGVDYYLVGGHAFYAQQEVYDLLNLLRALESPADEVALAGALRSPFFCLYDETIFWLATRGHGLRAGLFAKKLPEELDEAQAERVKAAAETLRELRAVKNRVPVAELIRMALDRTGYDAILLTEFLGERKLANLYKLIDQARSFESSGVFCLADFITQLSEFVVRQPKEPLAATQAEQGDIVRLMSIHQAKGLEFPVVFLPDLDRRMTSFPPAAVFSPQLGPLVKDPEIPSGFELFARTESEEDRAESVRLLYVATTRAADYLVLSSGIEKPKDDDENSSGKEKEFAPKGEWLQLLVRRFGLAKDIPIEDGDLIKVVLVKPELPSKTKARSTRVPLEEIEAQTRSMAEAGEGLIPPHLAPIAPDPSTRRQMSFSRLSGKLHRTIGSPLPLAGTTEWSGQGVRASALNEDLDDLTETAPRIDPLSLGTLVHAVLAEIDFAAPNNLVALLARHAPAHVGDDRAAVESAQRMLENFLSSPRAKEIANADRVYRELEFLLSWPVDGNDLSGRYFQGFIDLLYRDAGGWHLLDFKTNEVADKNLDAVAANYELQMLVYALAIEKIFGQPPGELTLHFLRTGRDYPFTWNKESRQRVVQLVDQSLSAGD